MLVASVLLGVPLVGCDERVPKGLPPPPRPGTGGGGGAGGGSETCDGPPLGACGHDIRQIEFDAPNIYFVFDRSGSMAELAPPAYSVTRYSVVHRAAVDMVRELGALISVGAALFPRTSNVCGAGDEVMALTRGDPTPSDGSDGPTTAMFRQRTQTNPNGGTPISATLNGLVPTLEAAEGQTIVFLLTDGGPNCNGGITCDAESCQPNLDGTCPVGENCCSPTHPTGGPHLCIDESATIDAVGAIAALGIPVYVIGITGSELYEDILDAMAEAGGTAQVGTETKYHRVTELDAIGAVLGELAGDAISCVLPLSERPSQQDMDLMNVYLDCELLPFDPVNGWGWLEGSNIWLHGDACDKLKSGAVSAVHVAIGCPTEIPK